jgi:5-formyltetrahydrofolate cyclo-ligase
VVKGDYRNQILLKRDDLSEKELFEKSRAVFDKLIELDEYKRAENILTYASFGSEVKTDEIILDALAAGKNVFCPKVTDRKSGTMEFVRIYSMEDLKEGFHGIREPEITPNAELFAAENALAVIPGVVFDRNNNRIGYNGGFYDRFLAAHKKVDKVAICFDLQVVEEPIPTEVHDIPMDKIISG